jgi:OOP family OmpA-OmpF porin
MKNRVAFACGMALVAAGAIGPAVAAEDGLYGAMFGGAGISNQANGNASVTVVPTTLPFTLDTDVGVFGGGALGYRFGGGFRAEGEVSYRNNKWSTASTTLAPTTLPVTGAVDVLGLMANAYYDLDLGSSMALYVGGGIGVAIEWADIGISGVGSVPASDSTAFAYQGIAGASIGLGDGPAEFFVEYLYFGTDSFNFSGGGGILNVNADYSSHAVAVGLRFPL